MAEFVLWAASTCCMVAVAFFAVRPTQCAASPGCRIANEDVPVQFSVYAVSTLGVLLLRDALEHLVVWMSNLPAADLVPNIQSWFLSTKLVCAMFAGLWLLHFAFIVSKTAWYAHVATSSLNLGRPVYTIIYAEWLFNVPILLTLAGTCALDVPLKDVRRPALLTNFYITLSWAAHFTTNERLRWLLVFTVFLAYATASLDMCRWIERYLKTAATDAPHRLLKAALAAMLVGVFGIYGAVYLASLNDAVSPADERLWYMTMDLCVKIAVSIIFTVIRAGEVFDTLVEMLIQTHIPFERQYCALQDGLAQIPPDRYLARL